MLTYFQVKRFVKNKMYKEIWIYIGLMLFGAIIGSIQIGGITLASPVVPLETVFEPLGKWLLRK